MVKLDCIHTPWGATRDYREIGQGITLVSTASHGGLKLSQDAWDKLPEPVQKCMFLHRGSGGKPSLEGWAEEDCDMSIVLAILLPYVNLENLISEKNHEEASAEVIKTAHLIANHFKDYSPCIPFLPALA